MTERRFHILVAEDSPTDVYLIQEAINHYAVNADLYLVEDGEQAIDYFGQLEEEDLPCPDLLLLDLHLPRRSGAEVLDWLKCSMKCSKIPVVVLTSSDWQRERQVVEAMGAKYYFQKPLDLEKFLQLGGVVRELLEDASS